MTFLHLLILVVGALGAIALADVLSHRGIGPWPLALLALGLVVLAGILYSAWLAAFSLGLALGVAVMMTAALVRSVRGHRRMRREDREQARAQEARARGSRGDASGR